jgi:hypothetical protein
VKAKNTVAKGAIAGGESGKDTAKNRASKIARELVGCSTVIHTKPVGVEWRCKETESLNVLRKERTTDEFEAWELTENGMDGLLNAFDLVVLNRIALRDRQSLEGLEDGLNASLELVSTHFREQRGPVRRPIK